MTPARERLTRIHRAALAAVEPEACVAAVVERLAPDCPLRVVAAGKAAAPMARALERACGERIRESFVVTKDGHGLELMESRVAEAGHPVPDERSEAAGIEALAVANRTTPGEAFVLLLSGGASALLSAPLPGLRLADVAAATRGLLEAGADIDALNTLRKHCTRVSGGRLARAAGQASEIHVLAISDVPGDDLSTLASGPCAADATTFADAVRLTSGVKLPEAIRQHLEAGRDGQRDESLKPGDPALASVQSRILASNATARAAALEAARKEGLRPISLGGELRGEAREAAARLVALGRSLEPEAPTLLVVGGETTVTVRGSGRGGRSQELALAAALALEGAPNIDLLAAGTDGTDGPTDAAGAFADAGSVARGRAAGVDARSRLEDNDAYTFFAAEGGLVVTGPTRTNVMDLVLLEVRPPGA
ncbi:MAG: DUF4147 domain-containing protein [Deltaproteobacteria bacterium]|nr:DUF4147 domain-containing protein [Deltaproteobacteria bacterium]MBW2393602.1 DUF4147 domain-containing protein [Deltaproteobacteria bacterium]